MSLVSFYLGLLPIFECRSVRYRTIDYLAVLFVVRDSIYLPVLSFLVWLLLQQHGGGSSTA